MSKGPGEDRAPLVGETAPEGPGVPPRLHTLTSLSLWALLPVPPVLLTLPGVGAAGLGLSRAWGSAGLGLPGP